MTGICSISSVCACYTLLATYRQFSVKSNMSDEIPPDQRISEDDLLYQISTFLFAGSDTTSLAMTWILFLLSTKQLFDYQKRLREELLSVDATSSQAVIFADLEALPLLDIIIKEGLRIIPPVHSSLRVATEPDVIPTSEPVTLRDGTISHGIAVAAGTPVHIAVQGFSLDKSVWGDDAWEFK
jgi:cytochrome P450